MALKDLLALADDKLHDVFSKKPYDPSKDRARMVKRIEKAHDQFHATEPSKGKKLFKLSNGVAELNLPFEIGGKSRFYVPTERFADFLSHLKDSVTGGELDKEIAAGQSGEGATKPKRAGGGGGAWSEERRAKYAATVAARNAKK